MSALWPWVAPVYPHRGCCAVVGASLDELTAGELAEGEQRVISGSVLAGHMSRGQKAYLGRYHNQVSVIPEDRERKLFGYLAPGSASTGIPCVFVQVDWRKIRFLYDNDQWQYAGHGADWHLR